MSKTIKVSAAIIRRHNKILIAQRAAHRSQGLLWEFPGGKIELNETPQEALQRECLEELGIKVAVGKQVHQVIFSYPNQKVHLYFFEASILQGEPQCLEHNNLQWVTHDELSSYNFCPANIELLDIIVQ